MTSLDLVSRIGFMQGRLSPAVGGAIQRFPKETWRVEFEIASQCGFALMEWTLDQEGLETNPVMTVYGRREVGMLSDTYQVSVPSLTGDCFMQAPFWRAPEPDRSYLESQFLQIVEASAKCGIRIVMVPLVDGGTLRSQEEEDLLVEFLTSNEEHFASLGVLIALESDFGPDLLLRFISSLPAPTFGINYDIGNSAALGYDPVEEIGAYGDRVINVHVKDRLLGGATVALGSGDADVEKSLQLLINSGYQGNFILQTARADDGDDVGVLCRYRDMTLDWLSTCEP